MANILLINLEQIKQEAEKLEELFPSLSQELRLDGNPPEKYFQHHLP